MPPEGFDEVSTGLICSLRKEEPCGKATREITDGGKQQENASTQGRIGFMGEYV